MTDLFPDDVQQDFSGGGTVGVMDAVRMGWRLVMADFWPVWVLGLVAYAIHMGCGFVGAMPYIGGCLALAAGLFIQAPLNAGMFFAVRRCIDGSPAQVGDVFQGFRERYWPSVVAILLPTGISFAFGLLIAGGVFATVAIAGGFDGNASEEEVFATLGVALIVLVPLGIIFALVMLLFLFTQLAVWDHPESGWEAMKDSVRVVKAHFWSTLGMTLLFGLIALAAGLLGVLACCVGVFFTAPLVLVWFNATLTYLYRSWTGQPLVQPLMAEEPPAEGIGPLPPTDIEPPPPAPPMP